MAVGDVDERRDFPRFAAERFTTWWQRQSEPPNVLSRGRVLLWPDTSTNNFEPDIRPSEHTYTLGQLLRAKASEWKPPRHGGSAIVQQHCHQHAVFRYKDECDLLAGAGVAANLLDAGCCGLAGNFGFERGHYDVSVACAEDKMLPAIRDSDPETLVLADGFSCRTQIRELAVGVREQRNRKGKTHEDAAPVTASQSVG